MPIIISTEINGFHEIRGTYNKQAKTITIESLVVLSIGRLIELGKVTLTKEEMMMVLKFFYDSEDIELS
ncbi:hypothetical protein I6G82_12415 [Lysinibacillus macroides]|uniref:Uncharacterized protein n=1 Tax=Lysinibacillus macroides TaxID=33935 RepID=A0A0M9DLX7_9BACI|nr:hypothetical protein [Lysinibacillus macroides]KOY82842.1 hypothetical protein ADM90_05845 [Lysinibacillus macroides]QPR66108.1 hypothetical protein I6G82_12415 [Lysinibacillus macroides]